MKASKVSASPTGSKDAIVVGEPRKTAITYAAKRKGTIRKFVKSKSNDGPTLGLPIDPEDMVCVNQPSRFEGIHDEKIAARRTSIVRRRSEPRLLVFRSTSSINAANLKSPGGSNDAPLSTISGEDDKIQAGKTKLKGVRTRLDELKRLFVRPLVHTEKRMPDEVVVNSTKVKFKVKAAEAPKEAVCFFFITHSFHFWT